MKKRSFLGNAFSDSVTSQSKQSVSYQKQVRSAWWQGTGRILLLNVFLWIGLFVLLIRLFQLTVIEGHQFRALADENRTRELIRHAPRGSIVDRSGKALVTNVPQFRLLSPCKDKEEQLCITRISEEEGKTLETTGLPAQHFLEVEYRRNYTFPEATAHVTGYTGEINEQELKDDYYKLRKYLRGDPIGRTGSEAVYEEQLRGRDGKELVEVDANGKILRTLGRDPEIPGENVTLSIDADLSQKVMEAFPQGKKGAVIVSIPQTGEILALYSSPSFSLNNFSLGMSHETYEKTINTAARPLFNRAIGGTYPPGSTYKLVSALAGLESGAISRDTRFEDTGVITIGPFSFPNWYFISNGKTEGMVDVIRALARSNDIYFYKAGEVTGISKLDAWSEKLGLGKLLGIELPGEAEGLLPNPAWKNRYFASAADLQAKQNEWYLGDTYHMSIGQGYLLSTPLQVNSWTNVIANGGYLCTPTIKKRSGTNHQGNGAQGCKDMDIKQESIDLITEGMRQACSDGGTAYPLFNFGLNSSSSDGKLQPLGSGKDATSSANIKRVPIACKTGTAEFGDPDKKTHAWITVFAPLPDSAVPSSQKNASTITSEPEISITVLVEEGGEGSQTAAPVAKKILEYWFSR